MKVSVIVPVFNSSKYLNECLDSIVKQDYQDIEIILVNDGSTDDSLSILEEYKEKYNNVVIYSITNHGQGYARNLGLKNCHGNYVMFIDSDDYVDTSIVSKLVNNIRDSDVIVCDMYEVYDKKMVYYHNYHEFGDDKISFMLSNPGPVAKLYRREVLDNVFFMEGVYYEDLAFTITTSLHVNKMSYIKEALYYYVKHESSTMRSSSYNRKMDSIFTVMDYVKKILSNYKEEYQYLLIEHLLYSATLRYIDYPECQNQLFKINNIMQSDTSWKNNKYYKMKGIKFKVICHLAYNKLYGMIRLIKKVSGK